LSITDFTYEAYSRFLALITASGYRFTDYHHADGTDLCVMRHDIDIEIDAAVRLAELERATDPNLRATYFVLLSSERYNVFCRRNADGIGAIAALGHEIGLHFDETKYPDASSVELVQAIREETSILGQAVGVEIKAVSMHIPSQRALQADYDLTPLVNSYSHRYFHQFKYLSDSMMSWRENAEDIISRHEYDNLHILTHPFWYTAEPQSARDKINHYLDQAAGRARDDMRTIYPD